MDKLLYRVDEAAAVIGLSRVKVYQMLTKGEIPSIKIGAARRIPADALRQWIDEQAKAQNTVGA